MASGAKILVLDDCVIKVNGGDRIDRQAEWLEHHQNPGIVKILGHWHGGYAMEKLATPDRLPSATDIVSLLQRYVWKPTTWNCDWDDVIKYAITRADAWWPEIQDRLVRGLERSATLDLAIVETHGDPTFENAMIASDGRLVLIDPIPPEAHLPSLLALDLGKILQSNCGYEIALRGKVTKFAADRTWLSQFHDNEQEAAEVFALYHLVRLMPYLPNDNARDRVKEIVGGNLLRLRH